MRAILSSYVPTSMLSSVCLLHLLVSGGASAFATPWARARAPPARGTLLVRGGAAEREVASSAFEWCANLGAPAALVAGAVLATVSELEGRQAMVTRKSDARWVRAGKKTVRFLLLSSFGLQVLSIFATTITGTMLLSVGDRVAPGAAGAAEFDGSALGYLRTFHEFESVSGVFSSSPLGMRNARYLTARITFLQGLFHWLGGVALTYALPKPGDGPSTRKMDKFVASALATLIVMMLSFYNGHMNFYPNYFVMLRRYFAVAWTRFVWRWPPRPLFFVYAPAMAATLRYGYQAFDADPDAE